MTQAERRDRAAYGIGLTVGAFAVGASWFIRICGGSVILALGEQLVIISLGIILRPIILGWLGYPSRPHTTTQDDSP